MRVIEFSRYGSANQLSLKEVPQPEPGHGQVLVRVHASSVNSWDWEFLNGKPFINRLSYGLFRPKPEKRVLGADLAGVVERVGAGVRRFSTGDKVFGDLWDQWGCFADYVCADADAIERMPENLSFIEAACVPQAGVLALQGLRKAESLQPGQHVLVNGAGGGVGLFAVQLAKLAGAHITGVDAGNKLDAVKSFGADSVIDYELDDFTLSGNRYDLIIDCQNYHSARENLRALSDKGVYAMIGGSIPRVYELWLRNILTRRTSDSRRMYLVTEGPNKGLADLAKLLESGALVPPIDRVFSLADVPAAMHYFGEGRHKGKIVINVAGDPT